MRRRILMFIWELQHVIYFLLFILSIPLLDSWKERLCVFFIAVGFSVSRPLRLLLGAEGSDHLVFYFYYEIFILAAIAPFLYKTKRFVYFVSLQVVSVAYLLYELLNWNNYTYTWEYYHYIQAVLLDLTLAVLVINKNNILTSLHVALYTVATFLLIHIGYT